MLPKTSRWLACAASGHVNHDALQLGPPHLCVCLAAIGRHHADARRVWQRHLEGHALQGVGLRGCGGWESAGVLSAAAAGGGGGGRLQGAPAMSLAFGSGAYSDDGPTPRAAALPVSCRA